MIASGRTRLGGKTPEQTITAMLAVGSKPGGPFERVDKGTYRLAEAATAPAEETPTGKPEAKPAHANASKRSTPPDPQSSLGSGR